jgi:hypothetical protein
MHRSSQLTRAASFAHDALAPSRPRHSQSFMDIPPAFLSHRSPLFAHEKSLFFRQGDYWVIGYRTAVALLKATRGLQDLALLLGNPGREFHVCELAGQGIGKALSLGKVECADHASQDGLLSDVGSILDAQAKNEYKRRLDELRKDLEEAERFNDTSRAERAQELDALAEQLAAAVGLGGRNRRIGSGAERARSAVTKRIKSSIKRIGETIPSLGSHLATRVRTGYFCSYSPHPERPVAWKF